MDAVTMPALVNELMEAGHLEYPPQLIDKKQKKHEPNSEPIPEPTGEPVASPVAGSGAHLGLVPPVFDPPP